MTTARVKQLLAVVFGTAAVLATAVVLARLADVVEATGRGADPGSGFTPALSAMDPTAVLWCADADDLIRPMDDGVRETIADAYLAAMGLLDGDPAIAGADPSAYLTGPALSAMGAGSPVTVGQRRHRLRVTFYSADGQIVEMVDRARMMLVVGSGAGLLRTETAVVVMVQVDGNWHLRHRVVEESTTQPFAVTDGRPDPEASPAAASPFATCTPFPKEEPT